MYGFTVMAWLFYTSSGSALAVPFASMEKCEEAKAKIGSTSRSSIECVAAK